jgi:hypothetical protein
MYDSDLGTRKLAHYNAWLLNPNRPDGERYPGFPETVALEASRKRFIDTYNATKAPAKPSVAPAPKVVKAGSKLEQAVAIYRELGGDKEAVIAKIKDVCDMSLAGATTYFYSAKKLA